ncbi:hypothetical protein [Acidianus two-tailed virus 2]|nr:hypothetical protein [Acidianus two-tailed virus 2]
MHISSGHSRINTISKYSQCKNPVIILKKNKRHNISVLTYIILYIYYIVTLQYTSTTNSPP